MQEKDTVSMCSASPRAFLTLTIHFNLLVESHICLQSVSNSLLDMFPSIGVLLYKLAQVTYVAPGQFPSACAIKTCIHHGTYLPIQFEFHGEFWAKGESWIEFRRPG